MESLREHVAQRRDANPFAPRRLSALYCYGVDFLSSKEVLGLFKGFMPQVVEWIDDSSCVLVCEAEEDAQNAIRQLCELGPEAYDEHAAWTKTRPLSADVNKEAVEGKAKAKARCKRPVFQLELRFATEADRKEVTHSGHTDSVYYAHVKEQQVLTKQAREAQPARQQPKRQRRSRLPAPGSAAVAPPEVLSIMEVGGDEVDDSWADALPGPGAAAGDAGAAAGDLDLSAALRLGCRGLMDPLLFLRAPGVADGGASVGVVEDLRTALRRAEAEYAAVPMPLAGGAAGGLTAGSLAGSGQGRGRGGRGNQLQQAAGRGRERTPPPGRGAQEAGGAAQGRRGPAEKGGAPDRGKKRRPVEQEPRAVSSAAPPQRKVQALPEVEAFLKEKKMRVQRFHVLKTFRSIMYKQQEMQKKGPAKVKTPKAPKGKDAPSAEEAPKDEGPTPMEADAPKVEAPKVDGTKVELAAEAPPADAPIKPAASPAEVAAEAAMAALPPWERYMRLNSHFTRHGQFMHTVAWEVDGRRVFSIVPHPQRTDLEVVARLVQKPIKAIRMRKLKDIAVETGFPVFVCPPFGHPRDSEGREPMLLIDSSVRELNRHMLFDCGSVGLSIQVSDFLRGTQAVCVDGLALPPKPSAETSAPLIPPAQVATSLVATPEPAPEPDF